MKGLKAVNPWKFGANDRTCCPKYETGLNGMNDMFRKKGKAKFEEKNVAAFKAGFDSVEPV